MIVTTSQKPAQVRFAALRSTSDKIEAGIKLFLADGTVETDSNVVERGIRPIALNRENALFAAIAAGHPTARIDERMLWNFGENL